MNSPGKIVTVNSRGSDRSRPRATPVLPPLSYVSRWGASSISMRKVSIGVSPMSLKKNRCSRHFRPMERRAGSLSSSLANLGSRQEEDQGGRWLSRIHLMLVVGDVQRNIFQLLLHTNSAFLE